jgi:hypothetical protein
MFKAQRAFNKLSWRRRGRAACRCKGLTCAMSRVFNRLVEEALIRRKLR